MIHFPSDISSGYTVSARGRDLSGDSDITTGLQKSHAAIDPEKGKEEKRQSRIMDPAAEKKEKEEKERRGIKDPKTAEEEKKKKERMGIKDPTEECQTCKNRKYKDGSDEMVSFKTPTKISPESAASAVRAHEQEHVSNAYAKAATKNGKVLSATVSIHTAICPECGRTYISGGTTHTQIKYYNEENPYQKGLKSADRAKYSGMHLNYAL